MRYQLKEPVRQFGFSLIELMIAMVLGMGLMGGALHVFINSKQTFAFSEEMTWMQESARYAMEFVSRDVRMAGYFGCGSQSMAVTLDPSSGSNAWAYDFDKGLVGYDGDDSGFPSDFPTASVPTLASGTLPKSDAFTVLRGATEDEQFTVTGHNTSSAVISVTPNHTFSSGQILVVSDCDHAAVFQTTGGNKIKLGHNKGGSVAPGNCTKGLGLPVVCTANGTAYQYDGDAFVMEVVSHAYFVNTASNNVPSIYRQEIKGGLVAGSETEELAQGVESIQTIYGLDVNGDGAVNRYVTADNVADWTSVMSIQIHLLMRSISEVTAEPVTFRFVGNSYTPTDRFLRKEFTSTIFIRNRGV